VNLTVGPKQGPKEPQALEVVEMQMAQQYRDSIDMVMLDSDAERPDPGTRVENQQFLIFAPNLDAGRVPAVPDSAGAGRRQ
jgi:hypothetical protein